jgi:hypothetical protein
MLSDQEYNTQPHRMRLVLEPFVLSMRELKCYYCGERTSEKICILDYQIDFLFGIRHCQHHKENAIRDCNAYLHKNKKVMISRLLLETSNPVFKRLIDFFSETPLSILRTTGNVDAGWTLTKSFFLNSFEMAIKLRDRWTFPMTSEEFNITKRIDIKSFHDSRLVKANEKNVYEGFYEDIDLAESILNEQNFYREDFNFQRLALSRCCSDLGVEKAQNLDGVSIGKILPPQESPFVVSIPMENVKGKENLVSKNEVRIFVV